MHSTFEEKLKLRSNEMKTTKRPQAAPSHMVEAEEQRTPGVSEDVDTWGAAHIPQEWGLGHCYRCNLAVSVDVKYLCALCPSGPESTKCRGQRNIQKDGGTCSFQCYLPHPAIMLPPYPSSIFLLVPYSPLCSALITPNISYVYSLTCLLSVSHC